MNAFSRLLLLWVSIAMLGREARAATFNVSMSNFSFNPANLTVNVGDTVTWTVSIGQHDTVSGSSGVPSGVWNSGSQFGRLMRSGERFSFTFTNPGTYPFYCTPHWTLGMTGSITVVAPNSPPMVFITNPSQGQTFSVPANITIQADATDDSAVSSVEFFRNGTSIGVVTQPPYQLEANNLGAGGYTFLAVATDNSGATASHSVAVNVAGDAPVITDPPQSQVVSSGTQVLLTVAASGSEPLIYQWSSGSAPIEGAAASSLLLTNVTTDDSGTYTVVVRNNFGSDSAVATLTVTNVPVGTPPEVTTHPESQAVELATNVTFVVGVLGSSPLFYQWFFEGAPIPNATNAIYAISNVAPANEGIYFVMASNDFGTATSSNAVLTVVELPPPPPPCAFSLSASNAVFSASGGQRIITVTAGTNCNWTVIDTNSWIVPTPLTRQGTGTVKLVVATNSGFAVRQGNVVIAGVVFTVTQAGAKFPANNDFDQDGFADFLWQNVDGRTAIWRMNGVTRISTHPLREGRPLTPGWKIVDTADLNGDGHIDLVGQHLDGRLAVWFFNGVGFLGVKRITGPVLPASWRLVGLGDFSGDGQFDFLFRQNQDGYLLLWQMNGDQFVRQELLFDGEPVPLGWKVAGVADFNGDINPDILWQSGDGSFVIWEMNGSNPVAGTLLSNLPRITAARVTGLNDLNQDGNTDILWRHNDGILSVWYMDGTNRLSTAKLNGGKPVNPAWTLVGPRH